MFTLQSLDIPIVAAPMAGGVSTPELVGAVGAAGGLGFVAGGYRTAEQLAQDIEEAQSASVLFGVNVFVPDPADDSPERREALERYRDALLPIADELGADLGEPTASDDDWAAKIDLLCQSPVPVVSFTFGAPPADVVERLHAVDTTVLVTVTNPDEARTARDVGADGLVVQGPEAGGHRGTFDPAEEPSSQPLPELLAEIRDVGLPMVAAGGLTDPDSLRAAFAAGAVAAQLGTAFLLSPEAGTSDVIRAALQDDHFVDTRISRTYTGRYARGLENEFSRRLAHLAPPSYPQVHAMTSPLRKAAGTQGNPQYLSLWAGTRWRDAKPLPAGEIVRRAWAAVDG